MTANNDPSLNYVPDPANCLADSGIVRRSGLPVQECVRPCTNKAFPGRAALHSSCLRANQWAAMQRMPEVQIAEPAPAAQAPLAQIAGAIMDLPGVLIQPA